MLFLAVAEQPWFFSSFKKWDHPSSVVALVNEEPHFPLHGSLFGSLDCQPQPWKSRTIHATRRHSLAYLVAAMDRYQPMDQVLVVVQADKAELLHIEPVEVRIMERLPQQRCRLDQEVYIDST